MAGWFDFVNGQTLPASRVQDYLMDQSVMVFADATARDAALGLGWKEGMVVYLETPGNLFVRTPLGWEQVPSLTGVQTLSNKTLDTPIINNAAMNTPTIVGITTAQSINAANDFAAGKNRIINGGFDIWQRATSVTAGVNGYFAADRWFFNVSGSFTASRQTTGVPAGSQYCMRVLANGAQIVRSIQFLETNESLKLAGRIATASMKIRRNSALTQNMSLVIQKSATVDAGIGATWTNISSVAIPNASMPTGTTAADWYSVSLVATIPNDGTANSLRFYVESDTIPNGGYYELAEVQLEVGNVATPFSRAAGTLQGELAACQRYFYKMTSGYPMGSAAIRSATLANPFISHPVEMRVTPTFTASGSNAITIFEVGTFTSTALGTFGSTPRSTILDVTSSGMTAGRAALATITTGQTIDWSAEL